jgi:hypothetical protein
MKFSACPVFTVKSLAIGVVVVGGVYFLYNRLSTKTEKK